MTHQTLIISNLPPECDDGWLRQQSRHPERLRSITVFRPDDPARHGITLVVELEGDRTVADNLVARFHGSILGGRTVRLYAPVFGG